MIRCRARPSQHKPLLRQVVLVMAHGITQDMLQRHGDILPNLQQLGAPATVLAPNSHSKPCEDLLAGRGCISCRGGQQPVPSWQCMARSLPSLRC
jgi:hypothetical protein